MRWIAGRLWFVLIILSVAIPSDARADSAVIVGAGQVGTWSTTGYVANPNSSAVVLSIANTPFPCQPPMECPVIGIPVAPLGSTPLDTFLNGGFQTLYLTQLEAEPPPFPLVHASLASDSNRDRSVDIPVVLVSRLTSANISSLTFGGVVRGPAVDCVVGGICYFPHSSLVLANVQRIDGSPGEDLPVTLELFDADGHRVGSSSETIPYGQTILIGDVVEYLGATLPGLGQLRVTRAGGGALMWGILYTTGLSGAVSASAGINLSPQ